MKHPWSSFLDSSEKNWVKRVFEEIEKECKLSAGKASDLSDVAYFRFNYYCPPDYILNIPFFSLVEIVNRRNRATEKYYFSTGTLTMVITYTRPRIPSVSQKARLRIEVFLTMQ